MIKSSKGYSCSLCTTLSSRHGRAPAKLAPEAWGEAWASWRSPGPWQQGSLPKANPVYIVRGSWMITPMSSKHTCLLVAGHRLDRCRNPPSTLSSVIMTGGKFAVPAVLHDPSWSALICRTAIEGCTHRLSPPPLAAASSAPFCRPRQPLDDAC